MKRKIVNGIARYGGPGEFGRCPDCGALLLVVYRESHGHGLRLVLGCSADCGYSRRPPALDETRSPEPIA